MSDETGREVGRIPDSKGRIVIVGVDDSMVTLRTLHTRTSGAVELSGHQAEEFGQIFVTAVWQAAWQAGWVSGGGGAS